MRPTSQSVTRLDYCQYLLVSQINYTLTNFAEHTEQFSHDAANRYLAGDQVRPHLVWENVSSQIVQIPTGCLVFDDTVVDKNFAHKIELVRRQQVAQETSQTIYQVKHGLLADYLRQQLKSPTVKMTFA